MGTVRRAPWIELVVAIVLASAWVASARPGPLSLPYFWDEADVYVPGARWLAEHGLNITPGDFPDDYSRGHPPLFYLFTALLFRVFGFAPEVGHLAVLPFTVVAIAGTYLLGSQLFGRRVGVAAALLFATTPLVLSIGNMMLPEMPLTALTVLAFVALSRGRLGLAILCGVAMVWIKETGIFSAAAIGVAVLYDARSALRSRPALTRTAACTIPLLALLAFFGWQHVHTGYFIFPHHQSLFTDRPNDGSNLVTVVPSLLLWHGRWLLVAAAGFGFAFGMRPAPKPDPARAHDPDLRWRPSPRAVLVGLVTLATFNVLFFAKMFWLERYALPAHPGVVILLSAALFQGFARLGRVPRQTLRWLPVGVVAFFGIVGLRSATPPDSEELTFAYADVIGTHREALSTLGPDDGPVLTTWPMTVELERPYLGYVGVAIESAHARDHASGDAFGAVVINTASTHASALRQAALERGMTRVARHQLGHAPAIEVYRRE